MTPSLLTPGLLARLSSAERVLIAGAMSRTRLLRIKPRVYAGTHIEPPLVTQHRARTVTIEP